MPTLEQGDRFGSAHAAGGTGVRAARWLGIALQALVLGVLLFGTTVLLLVMQSGARIFRYENF